jgi:hypothetical protein
MEISKLETHLANLLPNSESMSLVTRSGRRLPDEQVALLGVLMAQAQSAKPNQTLPDGTPDMFLSQWEDLVLEFGMVEFRAALLKALADSRFFPDTYDLRINCEEARREKRSAERAQRHLAEQARWKEECERERNQGHTAPQDTAGAVPSSPSKRERVGRHSAEEIQAEIAQVDPSALAAIRESMRARFQMEGTEVLQETKC